MNRIIYILAILVLILQGCSNPTHDLDKGSNINPDYLDFSNRDDQFTGGIKMIPISTDQGEFKVFTKTSVAIEVINKPMG